MCKKKEETNTIYEQMKAEYQVLQEQHNNLESEIKKLPKGKLFCSRNGDYIKWYQCKGHTPIYIPKSKRAYAEALAVKRYYSFQLEEIELQMNYLQKCITAYDKLDVKSQEMLAETSCYHSLLQAHFLQFPDKIQRWREAEYEHSTIHPEHLIHSTIAGEKVRSKSEVIIANTLLQNKIPYRYENVLHLNSVTISPDFTIMHPRTGKIYYLEHFGMMDNPIYRNSCCSKIKLYSDHNIILSVNLIASFETSIQPLSSGKIQRIIQEYFL